MSKTYLAGYVNEATALVVNDYPYGFRLRCKIRYWMEHNANGSRFCSQTTDPRKPIEYWNKPKKSTYASFGVMFLDEKGHVQWLGLSAYSSLEEMIAFRDAAGLTLPPSALADLNRTISTKQVYEAEKARGEFDLYQCSTIAGLVGLRTKSGEAITIERAREIVRERVQANAA
jgi:hypothetical protein